jgi:hypothetical protein
MAGAQLVAVVVVAKRSEVNSFTTSTTLICTCIGMHDTAPPPQSGSLCTSMCTFILTPPQLTRPCPPTAHIDTPHHDDRSATQGSFVS